MSLPIRRLLCRSRSVLVRASLVVTCCAFISCGDANEAPRVDLPVTVDTSGVTTVTTDLGYEVTLTAASVAVSDVVFTVAGEVHTASIWRSIGDAFVPQAYAHPGHYQGGEVTGELLGDFVVNWVNESEPELGVATLIATNYSAANFTFERGTGGDRPDDEVLLGHTGYFAGTASRDGVTIPFTIVVDSPEGRELVGAPFEASISETTSSALQFRFNTLDPIDGDTVFDGIDFEVFDTDSDGVLNIEPDAAEVEDAYNQFRGTFQTHDHFSFHLEE